MNLPVVKGLKGMYDDNDVFGLYICANVDSEYCGSFQRQEHRVNICRDLEVCQCS